MDLQERVNNLVAAAEAGGVALEQFMMHEPISAISPNHTANPGLSKTYLVVFQSNRQAIFKSFDGQSDNSCLHYGHDPYDAVTHEVVAWRLAHALGPPWDQLVPAAVLRDLPDLGGGALINFRYGSADWEVFTEARNQVMAAAFWDALVGQQDRHANNFRYDAAGRRLALIDHAFAFAVPEALGHAALFLQHRRRENRGPLTQNERDALEQLVAEDFYGLRDLLDEPRCAALEARAQNMLVSGLLPLPFRF